MHFAARRVRKCPVTQLTLRCTHSRASQYGFIIWDIVTAVVVQPIDSMDDDQQQLAKRQRIGERVLGVHNP